jgi:hypothetical protein
MEAATMPRGRIFPGRTRYTAWRFGKYSFSLLPLKPYLDNLQLIKPTLTFKNLFKERGSTFLQNSAPGSEIYSLYKGFLTQDPGPWRIYKPPEIVYTTVGTCSFSGEKVSIVSGPVSQVFHVFQTNFLSQFCAATLQRQKILLADAGSSRPRGERVTVQLRWKVSSLSKVTLLAGGRDELSYPGRVVEDVAIGAR